LLFISRGKNKLKNIFLSLFPLPWRERVRVRGIKKENLL